MAGDAAEWISELVSGAGSAASAASDLRAQLASLQATQRLTGDASEQTAAAIKNHKSAVDMLTAAMPALVAAERATAAAMKATSDAAKATENAQKKAKQEAADAAKKSADAQKAAADKVSGSISAAGGPVSEYMGKIKQLGEAMSTPEGRSALLVNGISMVASAALSAAAAIGAAAVAIGATLVTALGAGMMAAIHMHEAIEENAAALEALAGSAKGGAAVESMVQGLAEKLPFATSQIRDWAKSLLAVGLTGKALESSITAIGSATALMGESGGAAMEGMIKQLAEGGTASEKLIKTMQEGGKKSAAALAQMGLRSEDLAAALDMTLPQFKKATLSAEDMHKALTKAMQKKGKGAVENMVGDLATILMKAKEGLRSLFSKIPGVSSFMGAVKGLFGQFNKGSPIIKALGPVFKEVFGTLFSFATRAVKAVSAFVKENVNAKSVGKVWAGIKTFISAVASAFAPVVAHFKRAAASGMLMKGVGVVLKVVGAAIVLVANVIAHMVDAVLSGVEQVGALGDAFSSFGDAIGNVGGAVSGFIDGIVSGIASGGGAVIAAVTALAGSALGAFKSALGIASPSKVMAKQGGFMAEGTADGLDDGSQKVEASARKMGDKAADASSGAKAKGGKGKGGGGFAPVFTNCNFADTSEGAIRRMMQKIWEEDAAGGPEPEPA